MEMVYIFLPFKCSLILHVCPVLLDQQSNFHCLVISPSGGLRTENMLTVSKNPCSPFLCLLNRGRILIICLQKSKLFTTELHQYKHGTGQYK